jgi:hypothetical protein
MQSSSVTSITPLHAYQPSGRRVSPFTVALVLLGITARLRCDGVVQPVQDGAGNSNAEQETPLSSLVLIAMDRVLCSRLAWAGSGCPSC